MIVIVTCSCCFDSFFIPTLLMREIVRSTNDFDFSLGLCKLAIVGDGLMVLAATEATEAAELACFLDLKNLMPDRFCFWFSFGVAEELFLLLKNDMLGLLDVREALAGFSFIGCIGVGGIWGVGDLTALEASLTK